MMFLVPYCILLLAFFFWSVYCSNADWDKTPLFDSAEEQETVGKAMAWLVIVLTFYFILQEIWEAFQLPGMAYFNDIWAYIDWITYFLCLISVISYLDRLKTCKVEVCEHSVPGKSISSPDGFQ